MKRAELITAFFALLGIALYLLRLPFGSILIILSFSTLALIYFYLGIMLFNDKSLKEVIVNRSFNGISGKRKIGTVLTGNALSICCIGTLFGLLSWPGASLMLTVGVFGVAISSLVLIIRQGRLKSEKNIAILKRNFLIGGLGLIMLLLPPYSIVEFKYEAYPDYIEAVKALDADPYNQELLDKVEEEREKMMNDETGGD